MNRITHSRKNYKSKTAVRYDAEAREKPTPRVTRVACRLFDASPISRNQIQLRAGLGVSTLSHWASGSRKASVKTLDKALRVIGYRLTIEKIPKRRAAGTGPGKEKAGRDGYAPSPSTPTL